MAKVTTTEDGVFAPEYLGRWMLGEIHSVSRTEMVTVDYSSSISYRGVYTGRLSTDGIGNVTGTITGFHFFYKHLSNTFIEFVDLNADATRVVNFMRQGDIHGLLSYLLRGHDHIDASQRQSAYGSNIIMGYSGNDTIRGDYGDDSILGGAGNDSVLSWAGHDHLDGGTGYDTLVGGTGNDTYIVDNVRDTVLENAYSGTDHVRSYVTLALRPNLENLTLAGSASIHGAGNGLANRLIGNIANNTLNGMAGSDWLFGGAGNDLLYGNVGNDVLQGDSGNDLLIGDQGTNPNFEIVQVGRDTLFGGAGNDTLRGGFGADQLSGGDGDDYLVGDLPNPYWLQGYDDLLYGGNGNDSLHAGSGQDTLSGGMGDDRLFGHDGRDSLMGEAGNDHLSGSGDRDTLIGGLGRDTIDPGSGSVGYDPAGLNDVIVFNSIQDSPVGTGRDVIVNFSAGYHNINLKNIDANITLAGDQAFRFGGTRAAGNSVWYSTSGNNIMIRGDIDGDSLADFEIYLYAANVALPFGAGEFLL